MSLAIIRLFLGGIVQKLVQWLSHRSFWQLAFMAALLFGGIQTFRVKAEQRHTHKIETQLSKATAELNRLRAESKAQQAEVAKTVDHYITVEKPVIRKQVERIETAPLPGGCKTPQAVLEAGV